MAIPNIIKIFQTTYSRIYFEIHSGEVIRKQPWQMLSLLHVTRLLFDTNASTKYYQNMSNGIKVMERTRFWLQGMKKKLRFVSLAYDMPTGPPLHLYLISQYYLKQYGSYGLHKISASGETTT